MAQYLMFVFVLIILLSQFLVKKAEITNIPCVSKDDCPKVITPLVIKCIDHFCEYFWLNMRDHNHVIETMRSKSNN
ncbi:Nodule Cysteine-Rich (NCR) secreted peptide [Medicago truncatula]|uniref:Nodule Cysteine-Rich (NCR) secreted peptide n=1 Tax=Medicago truncatula TaxID=3880 RepID=A0A072UC74_MEDTR|nr:Nodule Cysteine-Rich (NCR) secreted peptide [Medicago truncatula]